MTKDQLRHHCLSTKSNRKNCNLKITFSASFQGKEPRPGMLCEPADHSSIIHTFQTEYLVSTHKSIHPDRERNPTSYGHSILFSSINRCFQQTFFCLPQEILRTTTLQRLHTITSWDNKRSPPRNLWSNGSLLRMLHEIFSRPTN